ncbi:MAG: PBECR2 nuclease fold domain-containing protein [Candidatus Acidiferrales bacterium]
MKPKRPELLEFHSLSELYSHFEILFLNGNPTSFEFVSACGHAIKVFDHHFFHMVKLEHPDKPRRLLMANEKEAILATTSGFGPYRYDRQRAIYLASAALCLAQPDEVWEDPSLDTAKWIYLKQFDASPYAFTIFLLGERDGGVGPVTSFPGKKRDARKWRRGVRVYLKNTTATPKGGS